MRRPRRGPDRITAIAKMRKISRPLPPRPPAIGPAPPLAGVGVPGAVGGIAAPPEDASVPRAARPGSAVASQASGPEGEVGAAPGAGRAGCEAALATTIAGALATTGS